MGGTGGGCAVYFLLFLFLLTVIATDTECQGDGEVSASRCILGLLSLSLSLIRRCRRRHCFCLFPLPSPSPSLCPLPSPSPPSSFLPLDLLVDCCMAPRIAVATIGFVAATLSWECRRHVGEMLAICRNVDEFGNFCVSVPTPKFPQHKIFVSKIADNSTSQKL
jgi:hypothetical protein